MSSMRHEPKDLSQIQQSWSYRAQTKIKSVAGRILEAQSSSQQILISVDRLLGQKNCVINTSLLLVSSMPGKKPVNLVGPLYCAIPHFTIRMAQVLADPSMRS
ncbi:hypothetical protein L3X38_037040 [Prunus dulcis]|uniref:Uncharacterized protein n=1 Tax=Prunus dulcis TaxID=3755 RepID=A0AAD4YQX1_PRUDU|nr:hypothetical protein L3X38_037040 [Prunus dulcis]